MKLGLDCKKLNNRVRKVRKQSISSPPSLMKCLLRKLFYFILQGSGSLENCPLISWESGSFFSRVFRPLIFGGKEHQ